MPKWVIAVCNWKGGTGKTTVSLHLAGTLTEQGYEVCLVDADPQGSASQWRAMANSAPFSVVKIDRPTLHSEVPRLASRFDFTLIDCPPSLGEISRSALICAHLTLIPTQPSPLDFWAVREWLGVVREAQTVNKKLKPFLLVCRKITGTTLAKEASESLAAFGIPVLKSEISQRIDFAKSLLAGETINTYAPHSEAHEEITRLAEEVVEYATKKGLA